MVAFDDGGVPRAGLDHVGVDGALGQIVHRPHLFGLVLKHPDELLADDLALALRLLRSGQPGQEALGCVHAHEIHGPWGERGLHLVPLVFPHEAVVHKHAGELLPHRLGQQGRRHRRVHPAGQGQQHPARPDLVPQGLDGGALVVAHGPVPRRAAHVVEEAAEHVRAVPGVVYLGMELHAVEPPRLVGDGHAGAGGAAGRQLEPLGDLLHIVPVAHPGDPRFRQAPEQRALGVKAGLGLAVFPGAALLGRAHPAPQQVGHELAAVADAQNGRPPGENGRVHLGRAVQIHRTGPPGENDADGLHGPQLLQRRGVGLHLAVYPALPHPAGDELVILPAEIQHDHSLMGHGRPSSCLEAVTIASAPSFAAQIAAGRVEKS